MKKKSFISMIVALSLTATIMVGATLAYLTSKTETITNTFTVGNVNIDLEESDWDPENGKDLEPGAEVAKNPIVTNVGKNDAYVAVTVDGMDEMAAAGFSSKVNAGWVLVDAAGTPIEWDGESLVDGIYVYSVAALAAGEETPALFESVLFAGSDAYDTTYVIKEIANDPADETAGTHFVIRDNNGEFLEGTYETKEAAEAKIAELEESVSFTFDLDITAYAIQTKGFDMTTDGVYTWVPEVVK